jgi:hypothetical protein
MVSFFLFLLVRLLTSLITSTATYMLCFVHQRYDSCSVQYSNNILPTHNDRHLTHHTVTLSLAPLPAMRTYSTYWLSLLLALPLFCSAQADTQVPLNGGGMDHVHTPETHASPRLVELLTVEPRASIFYTYARETTMSQLFSEEATGGAGVALLVPTNRAVMALAKKP